HPRLSNLTFCPEHNNSSGVGGVKIVYNEPCVLAGCRVNAVSSRQNCPDSMHQSFHVKLISGCIKQFRPSAIIKSNFLPGT
ncbi:hypothetical protein, partial [Escherichia coli]|uniref:hypothetical protein n=1 Tax=Escherichia coli TaxID=562 RepID=UPI001BC8500B